MTRTKSMTHFIAYADGSIELEAKARGLAEELFLGLKELAVEVVAHNDSNPDSKKDLKVAFELALIELENTCKAKLISSTGDDMATMAKCISGYKNRKSELKKGLKAGIDPRKYDTFTAYRKATDKATGSNAGGRSNTPERPNNDEKIGGGSSSKAPSKLQTVTNDNLTPAVRDKLTLVAKHLSKLSEADQLKVLNNCDGAIHKLASSGGRFADVKSATS